MLILKRQWETSFPPTIAYFLSGKPLVYIHNPILLPATPQSDSHDATWSREKQCHIIAIILDCSLNPWCPLLIRHQVGQSLFVRSCLLAGFQPRVVFTVAMLTTCLRSVHFSSLVQIPGNFTTFFLTSVNWNDPQNGSFFLLHDCRFSAF